MLEKIKGLTIGAIIDFVASLVTTVKDGLAGKKTYLMIAIAVIDQIGAAQGYWAASHMREIAEGALGAAALRAGVGK